MSHLEVGTAAKVLSVHLSTSTTKKIWYLATRAFETTT